mmetsp:Transcript_22973/g.23191  ORF Transcript_22973/g.23191 Transcript_22973/m.23191 type:complete len:756 (+) Transcript_22973:94-2361(+)
MIGSRADLCRADIIVIKAGTTVVSSPDGYPCVSRMASLVEGAVSLARDNKKVIVISSGAVGVGRSTLRRQEYRNEKLKEMPVSKYHASACAATGQLGLMSLYDTMFSQYEVPTSQLLVTCFDFDNEERRKNIKFVLLDLLAHGIVPVINENDAVSANQGFKNFRNDTFSDNDSLAAIISGLVEAKLMILLTDVAGVYDKPPSEPDAKLIDIFDTNTSFKEGQKSTQGRGGMGAKVDAALRALDNGVEAALIAPGSEIGVVSRIMAGEQAGTLLLRCNRCGIVPSPLSPMSEDLKLPRLQSFRETIRVEDMAKDARIGGRQLLNLDSQGRERILLAMAAALEERAEEIIAANKEDLKIAQKQGLGGTAMFHRLEMGRERIDNLVDGIRSIAAQSEPIGQILGRTLIAEGLTLEKTTTPIGVLLAIFESRPEVLPQIAALAIRSGNGLLLKGGKEAEKTNTFLHGIIAEAIQTGSDGAVDGAAIGLVRSRSAIASLLKLDAYIDLVIPRGSNALVKHIKDNTKIPVMGHSDGVCHLYVDKDADPEKALQLAIDGKTDYPSACNAIETILLHQHTVDSGLAKDLIAGLRAAGVKVRGGDRAIASRVLGSDFLRVQSFRTEYGDMTVSLDIVDDLQAAVDHINHFGSSHTDVIVTEDKDAAEQFLRAVDSACVYHNASSRFSDGFRFGLGAEVGISTGRIHARGPVGVEGLLTSKWLLRSSSSEGHGVGMFSHNAPEAMRKKFLHVKMALRYNHSFSHE